MSQQRKILFRVLAALLASATLLMSQVTGRLSGTVNDPSGGPVTGARVILYLADSTVEEATTLTDSKGNFLFPSLRPTYYDLAIEAANFKKSEQKGVKVDPLTETPLAAIQLVLGEARETVETQASANLLQTSTGQVSAVLSSEQVSRLPLAFRDPLALLDILPGVSSNGRAAARIINGQSTTFSNITYDGINIQTSFIRSNALTQTTNRLRTDQLSEATIVTANPASAFSGGSMQVAFSPPSGTNNFHVTAYWNHVNPNLAAQLFVSNQRSTPQRTVANQFGAAVSGPMIKNKLFYYLNYETTIDRSSVVRLDNTLPQALTSSDPTFSSALALFPAPNSFITTGFGTFNYRNEQNSHRTIHSGLARLDYLHSPQNTFSLTYSAANDLQDLPGNSSPFQKVPASYAVTSTHFFSGAWRFATKSGKLTNEARVGANLPSVDFYNRLRAQFPFILVMTNFTNPMLGIDPQGRDDHLYNYQDNVNYILGRHQLQAGASLQQYRLANYGLNFGLLDSVSAPVFFGCEVFNANCVAANNQALVFGAGQRFVLQSAGSGYSVGVPQSKPSMNLWSGYFQDNWKVGRGLTLNLGVRYDYQTAVRQRSGTAILPTITDGSFAPLYQSNINFAFVNSGRGLYGEDRNNFSPNLGFAWAPSAAKPYVIRGAYNVSYVNDDHLRHMGVFAFQNGFQNLQRGFAYPNPLPFPNRAVPATPVLPSSLTLASLRTLSNASVTSLNPDLTTPYVQQWNLSVETSFWKTIFSARYVGNNLTKGLRNIDVDPFRANPIARSNIWMLSNLGRSNYNALQLQAARRTRLGLALDVNYTFSKAISNLDDYNQGQFDPHLDIRNPGLNRALAPFDLRHAFKATWVYDFPKASFGGPMAGFLSNWSTSGILIAQSGAPFSILTGRFTASGSSVPATTTLRLSEINEFLRIEKDGLGPRYVNTLNGTFAEPALPSVAGALQTRMFTGPRNITFNMGLRKLFVISEGKSFEFRTEAFNLFNHVNWIAGDQFLTAGTNFGRNVGQVNSPRRLQFLLRLNF